MTDQQALHLYVTERDAEAFRELVDMYQRLVYAAAMRRLGNAEDAADATQQAFLRLARHAHTIRGDVGAWLHRTTVHAAADLMRSAGARRRRETRYARDAAAAGLHSTGPLDEAWEPVSRIIDEAIAELDDGQRELIVEHFLKERPQRELAAERGQSQATVSRRVQDAVSALRAKLEGRGVTAPAIGTLAAGLAASTAGAQVPAGLTVELTKAGLAGGAVPALGGAAGSTGGAVAGKVLAGVAAAGVVVAAGVGAYVSFTGGSAPLATPVAVAAAAATPAGSVPQDVLDRLGPVAPLVNENTLLVGRVDLRDLDPAAGLGWLIEQLRDAGPEAEAMIRQVVQGRQMVTQWRDRYLAAGGGAIYQLVVAHPDAATQAGTAYFFPDAEAARETLRDMVPEDGPGPQLVEVAGGLLMSDPQSISAFPAGDPVVPQGLIEAIQATPAAPAWLAFAPSPAWREQMQTVLAREQDPMAEVTRQLIVMQWFYVVISDLSPPGGSVVIESGSVEQAQAIESALNKVVKQDQFVGSWAEIVLSTNWQRDDSRLSLRVTPELVRAYMEGPLQQARAAAIQAHRVSNIRQVLVAMHNYHNEHERSPETLAELRPLYGGRPLDEGLAYYPPSEADFRGNPAERMVIHDGFEQWPTSGLPVGFLDGHVEVIRDRERFEGLREAAER